MASELDRLRELNARLQLVPKGTTREELERNAALFTHEAAKLLHAEGWGRIRKVTGFNIDGMDADKLLNKHDRRIVDIVQAAGAREAKVQWLDHGPIGQLSDFIEVRPDTPAQPPTPEPPATQDDALLEIANAVDGVAAQISELVKELRALLEFVRLGLDRDRR